MKTMASHHYEPISFAKTYLLFTAIIVLLFNSNLFAQKRIVLQHNGIASVYEAIDSVKVHLQAGDTIYLPGAGYNIETWVIDKRVTLFGAGHYPDSTVATETTFLIGNIKLKTGADNSFIQGIYLTGSLAFGTDASNQTVNNFTLSRCSIDNLYLSFDGSTTNASTNTLIRENVIRSSFYGGNAAGVLVTSNFLQQTVAYCSNTLFKNNILQGSYCGSYILNSINNCSFQNNIFFLNFPYYYCSQGLMSGSNTNNFKNNAFTYGQGFPDGTNTGSGNWTSINPGTFIVLFNAWSFSYAQNYHLQAPATYVGTDGTQIGIYGGLNPYKEGAVPINPHIQSLMIAPNTNTSGELNINIKVAAQDY